MSHTNTYIKYFRLSIIWNLPCCTWCVGFLGWVLIIYSCFKACSSWFWRRQNCVWKINYFRGMGDPSPPLWKFLEYRLINEGLPKILLGNIEILLNVPTSCTKPCVLDPYPCPSSPWRSVSLLVVQHRSSSLSARLLLLTTCSIRHEILYKPIYKSDWVIIYLVQWFLHYQKIFYVIL